MEDLLKIKRLHYPDHFSFLHHPFLSFNSFTIQVDPVLLLNIDLLPNPPQLSSVAILLMFFSHFQYYLNLYSLILAHLKLFSVQDCSRSPIFSLILLFFAILQAFILYLFRHFF